LASFLSFSSSSSTLPTITPPARSVGASTFSIFNLGVTSMPSDSRAISSTGFFFALRMFYTLANLGVFRRKSTVNTAGRLTSTSYKPKSTSRITLAEPVWKSILELKVAQGTSIIDARIYPVYM
jgi:hypothetical protein